MTTSNSGSFTLSQKTYDFLKKVVTIVLPAISTLYFALAAIWGLPAAEQVVGTLAAVATFGGVLLGISSKNYSTFGGEIQLAMDEGGMTGANLVLDRDLELLEYADRVTFKVVKS